MNDLVLFYAIGFFAEYRLEMSRAGYATMPATSVGFSIGQIFHLFITKNRKSIAMLPLVARMVLVLSMLLGALARLAVRGRTNDA